MGREGKGKGGEKRERMRKGQRCIRNREEGKEKRERERRRKGRKREEWKGR